MRTTNPRYTRTTRWVVQLLVFGAACSLWPKIARSDPSDTFRGVREPLRVIDITPHEKGDTDPDSQERRLCKIFENFVAIEDFQGKGASISVKKRSDKSEKNDCSYEGKAKYTKLPLDENEVIGSIGGLLVTTNAENFGTLSGFEVIDPENGRVLVDADGRGPSGFDFVTRNDRVSVGFFELVRLPCVFSLSDDKCWDAALKAKKLPAGLKIQKPTCKEALESRRDLTGTPTSAPFKTPDDVQIYTKVIIDDVRSPLRRYLGGVSLCDLTP